jgi:uncharacterized integral membrane protein
MSKEADIKDTGKSSLDTKNSPAHHSKIGSLWVTLAFFVVILLLLLIFIIQNSASVKIKYLGASGHIGFGVAILLAAVLGSALTLLIGTARIVQLKVHNRRKQEHI